MCPLTRFRIRDQPRVYKLVCHVLYQPSGLGFVHRESDSFPDPRGRLDPPGFIPFQKGGLSEGEHEQETRARAGSGNADRYTRLAHQISRREYFHPLFVA